MNRPANVWQLLWVVVLLVTATTTMGAVQSTETTINATESPNTTSTTRLATTTTDTGSPIATETPTTIAMASKTTATLSQPTTQTSRSNQATDNVPENATPIEVGKTVTGRLPVGDQDWSVFTVESRARITVSVTARNETNMSAFLYGGEDLLDSSFVEPGEQVLLAATVGSGGRYYVFIRNEASDTGGTYAFEVSTSEPTTNQPIEETTGDTDSGDDGLGFWTFALLGAVILLGFLVFRGGGGGGSKESGKKEGNGAGEGDEEGEDGEKEEENQEN